jgi:hypothetical protein
MKILSLDKEMEGGMILWVEDGDQYKKLIISPDNTIEEDASVPVAKYEDYEYFAAVMGKFDPYTRFRKEPPVVKELDFEDLTVLRHRWEKEAREYAKEKGWTNNDTAT